MFLDHLPVTSAICATSSLDRDETVDVLLYPKLATGALLTLNPATYRRYPRILLTAPTYSRTTGRTFSLQSSADANAVQR